MRILAVITGDYGRRHVANIQQHMPSSWSLETWKAPLAYPLVIDDPQDFIPSALPQSDLILSFAEHKGVIELLPDLALRCRSRRKHPRQLSDYPPAKTLLLRPQY